MERDDVTPREAGWSRNAQEAAEAGTAAVRRSAAPAPPPPDVAPTRPPGVLAWVLISMVAGAGAALLTGIALSGGGLFCSVTDRLSGANAVHAAAVVGAGTIVGAILAVVGRNDPRFLSVTLLLTAATLLLGVVLLGVDYAVARQRVECGLFGTEASTETAHLWLFGVVWAAAAIVLLWQAARLVDVSESRRFVAGAIVVLVCAWFVVRAIQGPNAVARASHGGGGHASVLAGTRRFPEPDHEHVVGAVTYDRTPPAGGAHDGTWLNCGIYDHPVRDENAVHSLEHGAVWITYRPALSRPAVRRLRQLVEGSYRGSERYLILSPYAGLPARVVASAWGAQLRLQRVGDPRLEAFIAQFAGGGQGGEPGGSCTDGVGSPVA